MWLLVRNHWSIHHRQHVYDATSGLLVISYCMYHVDVQSPICNLNTGTLRDINLSEVPFTSLQHKHNFKSLPCSDLKILTQSLLLTDSTGHNCLVFWLRLVNQLDAPQFVSDIIQHQSRSSQTGSQTQKTAHRIRYILQIKHPVQTTEWITSLNRPKQLQFYHP